MTQSDRWTPGRKEAFLNDATGLSGAPLARLLDEAGVSVDEFESWRRRYAANGFSALKVGSPEPRPEERRRADLAILRGLIAGQSTQTIAANVGRTRASVRFALARLARDGLVLKLKPGGAIRLVYEPTERGRRLARRRER